VLTKICTKCGEEKSLECFGTNKHSKDGLRGKCKTCTAAYIKQYRRDNPEQIAEQKKQYYKENTERIAAGNKLYYKDNYEKRAEYQKQYRKENAEKMAARDKQYREVSPEKVAAKKKKWSEANPEYTKLYQKANPEQCRLICQRRRARKKSLVSDFTMEQWESCLLYFNYKDAYTGLPLDSPSQDHVTPLSKGGDYTVTNIVPCNRGINSSKGNRNMATWFRKQTYYDIEREKRILAYLA